MRKRHEDSIILVKLPELLNGLKGLSRVFVHAGSAGTSRQTDLAAAIKQTAVVATIAAQDDPFVGLCLG